MGPIEEIVISKFYFQIRLFFLTSNDAKFRLILGSLKNKILQQAAF